MASFKLDPSKTLELLRKYRPEIVTRPGVGGTEELLFLCPFHPDSTPSFSFNTHKGVGQCYACKRPSNLPQLIAQFEGKTEQQVKKLVSAVAVEDTENEDHPTGRGPGRPRKERSAYRPCGVTLETINQWHVALNTTPSVRADLIRVGNFTDAMINHFKVGWDGNSYTIPLLFGDIIVNVKHYKPAGSPKYWGEEGANTNFLWPLENLQRNKEVWIVEGEKDCMRACMEGLNAITFTGGAGSFSKDFLRFFKDKNVNICYDVDDAGRAGAVRLADILHKVAAQVKIVDLPEEGLPVKGDISDFYNHGGLTVQLTQIAQMVESHKGDKIVTKIPIPDEVADTYLEDILPKKYFYRRVRMRVRVASIATGKAYLVPREVRALCSKDWKDVQCMSCPMYLQDGGELTMVMRPTYPEILQVVDGNDKKQREALRSMLDISVGCPKFKLECKQFQSLYPIVIIPALEKDKPHHSYTMCEAWALDLPAQPNEDYLCEAVVLANPDTQGFSIIVYSLVKDISSADEFELDDALIEQLRIFSCLPLPTLNTALPKSTTTSAEILPTLPDDRTCTSQST